MITPHACHESRRFGGEIGVSARFPPGTAISMAATTGLTSGGFSFYGRNPPAPSASHLLDARDHLVDRLLHRPLLGRDAVHRLRPDVLVVEDGELVVPGEFEVHHAGRELLVHDLAVR